MIGDFRYAIRDRKCANCGMVVSFSSLGHKPEDCAALLNRENERLCILLAWLNDDGPCGISTEQACEALGLPSQDWGPMLEMVGEVEQRGRALVAGKNEQGIQDPLAQLRDALERAHDAINDLVPSGLDWDWWLVKQTGNDAHKGLHELIEKALKVQP